MARNRETKIELTAYDDLFQTDESRAEAALSKIRDIPLSEIDEFPDHPFKVLMDEDMEQLVESIKRNGVMTPAITVSAQKAVNLDCDEMLIWGCVGKQTMVSGASDPVYFYFKLDTETYGTGLIKKTSEDGVVSGIKFNISGNGVNQTVVTKADGTVDISLMPGVYTVTEQPIDRYEPQSVQRITIVSGHTSTVTFSNTLKRGSLEIIKSSEDNLVEGVKFHLYGTSLSGLPVDEYAVTDANGVARFENVLISGADPYTVEEIDTATRYVIPASQTAPIEWEKVTSRSFTNILKKFNVTVTKSDAEMGTAQGDASLAGAVYGIYKGEELIDTYTTDKNGQFKTKYYVCGNDWTVREISPSEGYLLDRTIHKVGAEPELYTVEFNSTANDVTEQVIKGNIAIIKHTDNGETQIETPETGAAFEVFRKAAGSFDAAKETERDILTCDENGFAQTKDMPYGIYTVRQTSGWEGRELMKPFDVFISKDGQTYRYLTPMKTPLRNMLPTGFPTELTVSRTRVSTNSTSKVKRRSRKQGKISAKQRIKYRPINRKRRQKPPNRITTACRSVTGLQAVPLLPIAPKGQNLSLSRPDSKAKRRLRLPPEMLKRRSRQPQKAQSRPPRKALKLHRLPLRRLSKQPSIPPKQRRQRQRLRQKRLKGLRRRQKPPPRLRLLR